MKELQQSMLEPKPFLYCMHITDTCLEVCAPADALLCTRSALQERADHCMNVSYLRNCSTDSIGHISMRGFDDAGSALEGRATQKCPSPNYNDRHCICSACLSCHTEGYTGDKYCRKSRALQSRVMSNAPIHHQHAWSIHPSHLH